MTTKSPDVLAESNHVSAPFRVIVIEHGARSPSATLSNKAPTVDVIVQGEDESMHALTQRVETRLEQLGNENRPVVGAELVCSNFRSDDLLRWRLLLSRSLIHFLPDDGEFVVRGKLLASVEGQKEAWAIFDTLLPQLGTGLRLRAEFPVKTEPAERWIPLFEVNKPKHTENGPSWVA